MGSGERAEAESEADGQFHLKPLPAGSYKLTIVAEGRTADIIATVLALGSAKTSIGAGIEVAGVKGSASFPVTGSKDAIKTVREKCKLGR